MQAKQNGINRGSGGRTISPSTGFFPEGPSWAWAQARNRWSARAPPVGRSAHRSTHWPSLKLPTVLLDRPSDRSCVRPSVRPFGRPFDRPSDRSSLFKRALHCLNGEFKEKKGMTSWADELTRIVSDVTPLISVLGQKIALMIRMNASVQSNADA